MRSQSQSRMGCASFCKVLKLFDVLNFSRKAPMLCGPNSGLAFRNAHCSTIFVYIIIFSGYVCVWKDEGASTQACGIQVGPWPHFPPNQSAVRGLRLAKRGLVLSFLGTQNRAKFSVIQGWISPAFALLLLTDCTSRQIRIAC